VRTALSDLLDQRQPFGRLALVHVLFAAGTTLVTISLAGTLFFSISPRAAEGRVVLYLLLTIAPFAVVAPFLSPLIDRGRSARRTSIAVATTGSAAACFAMADDVHGLLLFPEAFAVLVLSKLYLVAKSSLVPAVAESEDDLASANAKLAVLASLAGFVASPLGVGLLQLGASWALRGATAVFLAGAVTALRLPRIGARGGEEVPGATAGGGAATGRRVGREPVAELRRQLGLPLFVPEVTLAVAAMSVVRGSVGFATFLIAFGFRRAHAATWWYGVALVASGAGSLAGSLLVPRLRRAATEQHLLFLALLLSGLTGVAVAAFATVPLQALLTLVLGLATTTAKPSYDSVLQRFVPPAALGRAFARFEAQLQLVWVVGALVAVVGRVPLAAGDALVGVGCAAGGLAYVALRRSRTSPAGEGHPGGVARARRR
jgi:hypothetical protein